MAAPGDTRRCWILLVNSGLPPGTVSLSRAPILVPSVKSVAFPSSVCAICGTHIGRDDRRGIGPDAQKNGGVGFRACKVAARREPYLSHVPNFGPFCEICVICGFPLSNLCNLWQIALQKMKRRNSRLLHPKLSSNPFLSPVAFR